MGLTGWLLLCGGLFFAGASFFFALAETALFALGKWRARQLAEQSPEKGVMVFRLLQQPAEILATISLGNTLANSGLVALALWRVFSGDWPALLAWASVLLFILVGCEVLPKTLAVRAPEAWALRVARPMLLLQEMTGWFQQWVQRLNGWLLRALLPRPATSLSDEEYQELLEMAHQQGTLAQSEK